jgi:hypothetical protein
VATPTWDDVGAMTPQPRRRDPAWLVLTLLALMVTSCGQPSQGSTVAPASFTPGPPRSTATAPPASMIPALDGADLPADLVGTYYDAGEASVGWDFLAAGDEFCRSVVHTEQSCLRITRPQAVVDYGPMVLRDGQLVLRILYDEDGMCLTEHVVRYSTTADGVDLHHGVCQAPRERLVRGQPKQ